MAVKKALVEGIGEVTLYKRRGTRNMRLRVSAHGSVSITMPMWAPYGSAIAFAREKQDWIISHKKPTQVLRPQARIGKAHRLEFISSDRAKPQARVKPSSIEVYLPREMEFSHPEAQLAAAKASIKSLKQEASSLLPQRLKTVANKTNFQYRSVSIKQLKGRWGSCNQHGDIVLNCYLMQLPWDLIDYVILHELVHTKIMAHGNPFWSELANFVPNLPEVRKTMRSVQPVLMTVES